MTKSKSEIVFSELNSMPEYQKLALAQFALAMTEACFDTPGMEERFQAWLPEYLKRLNAKGVMP